MMERIRLSEVINIIESGDRPKGGVANNPTGVLSIGGEHIEKDGSFNLQNRRYIPADYYKEMKRGRIAQDDILIVKDGATTGKVAFVDSIFPQPAAINEHVFRITANPKKVLARYVFYHLLSSTGHAQILKDFRGSTVGGISQSFPDNVELACPSLSRQTIIVNALDQTRELLKIRSFALESCLFLSKSFFLELFGDPQKNDRRWEQKILDDELSGIESGSSPVCEGPRSNSREWAVLSLGAVTYGIFDAEQNKQLPENIKPDQSLEVKEGDVLISRKNTLELVAACVYAYETQPRLLLPDTIFRFKLRKDSLLTPEYLWGLFSFPTFRKYIQSFATGTAGSMPNISKEKLLSVMIPVPPNVLQTKFSNVVSSYFQLRKQLSESLRQAEHLFQSLLHQAFNEN